VRGASARRARWQTLLTMRRLSTQRPQTPPCSKRPSYAMFAADELQDDADEVDAEPSTYYNIVID